MTYVMSDIHGYKDRYDAMLERIGFSSQDRLYVLGDVIDRGEHGIEILEDMMSRDNVYLILGNHEAMCLASKCNRLVQNTQEMALWAQNGGKPTYRTLMSRNVSQRRHILKYMAQAPDCMDVEVDGRVFHLVHACPGPDRRTRLWSRPSPLNRPYFPDSIVIVGHTPTSDFRPELGLGKTSRKLCILDCGAFIAIDCGCGTCEKSGTGRLGCLRLDDMAEFYEE